MVKFQRNYRLELDGSDGTTVILEPPFTLDFDITRSVLSSVNHAQFRITGLGRTNRSRLYKDSFDNGIYRSVIFRAGYGRGIDSSNLAMAFRGNMLSGSSKREGTRMITTIEGQDGGYAFATGQVNGSFSYGTTNLAVLQKIVLGLNSGGIPSIRQGAGLNDSDPSRMALGTLGRGNTISGPAADLARERSGGAFFIDNETAHVLADEEVLEGAIQEISSSSGLLGTPQRQDGYLILDMLFEPRLLIGQSIHVDSVTEENFIGDYKVLALKHRGIISAAVGGQAVTTVTLWFGNKALRTVRGGSAAVEVLSL